MPVEFEATVPAPTTAAHVRSEAELDATAAATGSAALDATAAATGPAALDATAAAPADGTVTAGGRRGTPGAYAIGPGTRLAHFEIVRPLGHGGMGEVYLATDLALDRPVALKLLPAAVARDPGRRERLIREARAQARLNHPNVAHLYFIGEDLGHLFFAMEYIDGETLAQRLERGPLPADVALELARMAALGLREAHRHGFTHRDVKPSNLMIDQHGVLKVMDFGLVTEAADGAAPPTSDDDAPIAASALVGTPLYMAPEQGRGRAVDHRADIYALGATLHHMIAGAPPFAGGSAAELQSQHEAAARASLVGARRRRRTVGLADVVITRMMAKRPFDRPATYDELIDDLDRANPVRSRPAGFWPRAVAGLVDLIGAGLIAVPIGVLLGGNGNLGLGLYFLLLIPLVIRRFGTTLGHALFDLAIVPVRGARTGFLTAALRYLVMLGPMMAGMAIDRFGDVLESRLLGFVGGAVTFVGFAYPLVELARVALTTADAATLWDRAARTRVRYRVRGSVAIGVSAGALASLPPSLR
ncbi:MAG: protein kinase [Myxococcales bacterium]|nr:protein kinase [Myxococcales bacterium]